MKFKTLNQICVLTLSAALGAQASFASNQTVDLDQAKKQSSEIRALNLQTKAKNAAELTDRGISRLVTPGQLNISAPDFQKRLQGPATRTGGIDGGGGNAVGDVLLDFYEGSEVESAYAELKEFSISDLESISEIDLKPVSETLSSIQQEISKDFFNWDMFFRYRQNTPSKRWFFTSQQLPSRALGLTEEMCLNVSDRVTAKQTIVACQDDRKVVLYLPWLKSANETNQSGLFLHELLIEKYSKSFESKRDLETFVRRAVHYIFSNRGKYTVTNIRDQSLLSVLGVGSSPNQVETFIASMTAYRSQMDALVQSSHLQNTLNIKAIEITCDDKGNVLNSLESLSGKASHAYRLSVDGRLTQLQQHRMQWWGDRLFSLVRKVNHDRSSTGITSELCSRPINF